MAGPKTAQFLVPDGVYDQFQQGVGKRGADAKAAYDELFEKYAAKYPDEAKQLRQMAADELPDGWGIGYPDVPARTLKAWRRACRRAKC